MAMKSLLSRLRHNRDNATARSSSSSSRPVSQQSHREVGSTLAQGESPRPSIDSSRTSTPIAALHSQTSSSSSDSTRPQSLVGLGDDMDRTGVYAGDSTIRGGTLGEGEDMHVKKVTFRSPIPTPTTSAVLDETHTTAAGGVPPSSANELSAFPSQRPMTFSSRPPSASSRSDSRQSLPPPQKHVPARKSSMMSERADSPAMSPTPSVTSLGGMSRQSYLPPPASWSEMAEDELIANIGPRERTRQEVLYEIVSSEERYVQELIKLNETFCRALLRPSAVSPSLDLIDPIHTLSRRLSPTLSVQPSLGLLEQNDFLPIAAQYSSQTSSSTSTAARAQAYNALTNGRPSGLPGRTDKHAALSGKGESRSHSSLPPNRRDSGDRNPSIAARMSYRPGTRQEGYESRATSFSSTVSIRDVRLPEALEKVLTVLGGGVLEGHIKLAAALRRRYDDQYPLVRSLADVFTSHSYILREYATYVNNLESALEQVEHALTTCTGQSSKRASRRLDDTDLGRLGKGLLSLEELAAERGESGLQISLSKPFQRLLKYPLLFQNLLFNTDPSLKEYEATLTMVDDVEEIVRAIEDEKASVEEREKTRDVWARIEGLDQDKTLMVPKPNRLLVSEASTPATEDSLRALKDVASKQKKSFRRLSDILKGPGEADLWVVRFTDVSLLCTRTGMTHLPASNTKTKRSESSTELGGKSKSHHAGRRAASVKARNLYRFLKIHEWHLKPKTGSTEALVSMNDISQLRAAPTSRRQTSGNTLSDLPTESKSPEVPPKPTKVPLKGDGGGPAPRSAARHTPDGETDTMVSDRLSVMSFAFKGTDQMTPTARRIRPSAPPGTSHSGTLDAERKLPATNAQRRTSAGHMTGNAANAKFGHRLRSHENEQNNGDPTLRPASRTRQSLPPAMIYSSRTGRSSPALGPADRNAARPAISTTVEASKTKAASVAPSTKESVRGARIETSVTGQGRRVVPKAITALRVAEGNNGVGEGGDGKSAGQSVRGVRPSQSADSSVAGMWTAYRDGGATGTPRKVPTGRQLGGRI